MLLVDRNAATQAGLYALPDPGRKMVGHPDAGEWADQTPEDVVALFAAADELDPPWPADMIDHFLVTGDLASAALTAAPDRIAVDWLDRAITVKPASAEIAAECSRRIYAVASQNCVNNINLFLNAGGASDQDRAAAQAALAWIQAMRTAYAALAADADPTFAEDAHWPACPPEAAALAARF